MSIHKMGKDIHNKTFDMAHSEHMVCLLKLHFFFHATRVPFSELPA